MAKNEWLSVSEVSSIVGIPVETIRRYIRLYSTYLKVEKVHKRYLVHNDCVAVLKQIRELFAGGNSIEKIENILLNRRFSGVEKGGNISHERMTDCNEALELKRSNPNNKDVEETEHPLISPILEEISIGHERVTDEVLMLKRMLDEQKKINEQQASFNKFLLEKLSQQEENDQKRLKKFDEALRFFEEERQSLIEMAAGRQGKAKRKGTFLNLF